MHTCIYELASQEKNIEVEGGKTVEKSIYTHVLELQIKEREKVVRVCSL